MVVMQQFMQLTNEVRNVILEDCLNRYEHGKKFDRKNYDDFNQVKAETLPLFEKIEKWEEEAQAIVHKIAIFPNQIQNTKDNLEIMILHSYFHDVRKKRFMELYQSVMYNLDLVINDEK
ncbi:hypothetical protein AHA02nite_08950 [Alkalibacillus haloalkaliphilus]|uniref:DUF1798 domain-containing protein n=2 Tax=Alkalibacillus haloalkaliphilus TaxID=94136 RepID=A0A511W1Z4_9BACI|nr:hypothetical protein AHA02nite_08950 [Alkalibacillus haloalkaliphilus]